MSSRDLTEEPLDTRESSARLDAHRVARKAVSGLGIVPIPGLSRSATSMGLRALAMHAYLHKRGHKERKFLSEGVINCRVAKDLQARSNPYDTGNPCIPGCCWPHEPQGFSEADLGCRQNIKWWRLASQVTMDLATGTLASS